MMVNIFIFFQEKGNSIMPKGCERYSGVCVRFLKMYTIYMMMVGRKRLHIYDDGELCHKSYNVGIKNMMIHRKIQLLLSTMAGFTRLLVSKFVGSTHSCNHHQPLMMMMIAGPHRTHKIQHQTLMMRMMQMIICQVLVVTIPCLCLDVVYSHSSLGSGGGKPVTCHIHKPNKLSVKIRLGPGERLRRHNMFEDDLMFAVLRLQPTRAKVDCELDISGNLVKATLTFTDPENLHRVKKVLKTLPVVVMTKNWKACKRYLSVEVVQPKKSEKTPLLDFDMELLEKLKEKFGKKSTVGGGPLSHGHPSFMDQTFLKNSGLFDITSDHEVVLKTTVKNMRLAIVYSRRNDFYSKSKTYRIAHPDCPDLPKKCKDMCNVMCWDSLEDESPDESPDESQHMTLRCSYEKISYEHYWKPRCHVKIPKCILDTPEFWESGFKRS